MGMGKPGQIGYGQPQQGTHTLRRDEIPLADIVEQCGEHVTPLSAPTGQ
jgi:hypothetical protein